MKNLLFDIEATGLLRQNSQIHCIVVRDLDNPDSDALVFDTVKDNVAEGVKLLESADVLSGHNICGYDLPLIQELFPAFKLPKKLLDTLILSRIYYSTLDKRDFERRPYGLHKRLYGSHGLKAWGYRLGCLKGEFAESNDWHTYTPEMLEYCIQDTTVNLRLFELLHQQLPENEQLSHD